MRAGLAQDPDLIAETPMAQWSDDEVLPFDDILREEASWKLAGAHKGFLGNILAFLAHVAPLLIVLRGAYSLLKAAADKHNGVDLDTKKFESLI